MNPSRRQLGTSWLAARGATAPAVLVNPRSGGGKAARRGCRAGARKRDRGVIFTSGQDLAALAHGAVAAGRRCARDGRWRRVAGDRGRSGGRKQYPICVRIYGRAQATQTAEATCLRYGSFHTRPVRVIVARTRAATLALITTDLATSPTSLIERYAARWSIEQAFADARHILGAGEARTHTPAAVARTVPFALLTHTLIVTWYARHGHDPADITARRTAQPWYQAKTEPAFEDMLTKLRRTLITTRISGGFRRAPHTQSGQV